MAETARCVSLFPFWWKLWILAGHVALQKQAHFPACLAAGFGQQWVRRSGVCNSWVCSGGRRLAGSLSSLLTGGKADPVDMLVSHLAHAKEVSSLRKGEQSGRRDPQRQGAAVLSCTARDQPINMRTKSALIFFKPLLP